MANEKRLIDANGLMKAIKDFRWYGGYPPNTLKLMFDYLKIIIYGQPTVDAVPVMHGRWEKAEYCGFLRCSQCTDVYIDESWLEDGKWNYCPNCGAKMDGDGNG